MQVTYSPQAVFQNFTLDQKGEWTVRQSMIGTKFEELPLVRSSSTSQQEKTYGCRSQNRQRITQLGESASIAVRLVILLPHTLRFKWPERRRGACIESNASQSLELR